ncbi:MAG: hypothetical protein CFE38_14650 [Comamonadaceae bacterium PBBC1]|nr:MAG: hypothetical protein CFE38_14650 [Comamonadaceae bacterium PBBC1]
MIACRASSYKGSHGQLVFLQETALLAMAAVVGGRRLIACRASSYKGRHGQLVFLQETALLAMAAVAAVRRLIACRASSTKAAKLVEDCERGSNFYSI